MTTTKATRTTTNATKAEVMVCKKIIESEPRRVARRPSGSWYGERVVMAAVIPTMTRRLILLATKMKTRISTTTTTTTTTTMKTTSAAAVAAAVRTSHHFDEASASLSLTAGYDNQDDGGATSAA